MQGDIMDPSLLGPLDGRGSLVRPDPHQNPRAARWQASGGKQVQVMRLLGEDDKRKTRRQIFVVRSSLVHTRKPSTIGKESLPPLNEPYRHRR